MSDKTSALQPITERTFYLPGANNLGVVATDGGGAIVIDTGLDKDVGRTLRKALDAAGLRLHTIINTHHHADHIGGNAYLLRNIPGVLTYAPPLEAALIEHPILEPVYLNQGAGPHKALRTRRLPAQGTPVHHLIGTSEQISQGTPFPLELAGVTFEVIPLPGHSIAQIGLACDGVCFAADGFFGPTVPAKYGVPYVHDVADQLAGLERLAVREEAWFLPGHGPLTARADLDEMLNINRTAIIQSSESILQALQAPGDVPAITARVLRALGQTPPGIPQYAIFAGAVAAHLTYLEQQGRAAVTLDERGLIWRRTEGN